MKNRKVFSLLLSLILLGFSSLNFAACNNSKSKVHSVHTLIKQEAIESTCTHSGEKEHYRCFDCGKIFEDAEGAEEIEKKDLYVAPYGHEFSAYYKTDEVGHIKTCLICGATEKEEHSIKELPATLPTMSSDGHTEGMGCEICGYMSEGEILPKSSLFTQQSYRGYNYCIYEPSEVTFANADNGVPLVLFLHGAGERGNDNATQLRSGIQFVINETSDSLFMDAVVIAPQCPIDMQWVNTPWVNGNYTLEGIPESSNIKKVVELVKYYRGLRCIDSNRIYVVGLSMGGFGTWDILARHSDLFAAGVPICGGGPTDGIDTLKDMPIYTFHGTQDEAVPFAGTEEMARKIEEASGKKLNFVIFPGDGHSIWNKSICYKGDDNHPALDEWLFSQSKEKA